MEEDLLFDIIDVLRELRFSVEPLANDTSSSHSPTTTTTATTTLLTSSSSPISHSLPSVNKLCSRLVQQSMLLEQFVRQLHESLYTTKNTQIDVYNKTYIQKQSTWHSISKSVAMQISPAVELLLIRKFGDVLEGAHGVRLLTEMMYNERSRKSSVGELSTSINNTKSNVTGHTNKSYGENSSANEKGKLPLSLPPLSPKSASTTSLSSFTSLSCVQNKYDEQHVSETIQRLLQNIEDAMRLLRIAYPYIFTSVNVSNDKINTLFADIGDNAWNSNYNDDEDDDNDADERRIASYSSSESDDSRRTVSSASSEELDTSAPTAEKIVNRLNSDDNDKKEDKKHNTNSTDDHTEERVSDKDDSESLMSTLNTHRAASPLLRSVTIPCRDASQEQTHTDSLDATINTVIGRTSSNERWSGENSPVIHAVNVNQLPLISVEQVTTSTTTTTTLTSSKETVNSRQLQSELTMFSSSSKSSSEESSQIQQEERELTKQQSKDGRKCVTTKGRTNNSAHMNEVGTPPLHASPSSAKLVMNKDIKRSQSESNKNDNNNVFYSVTEGPSESSPRMSVNTIPYYNHTPTRSTSLSASPLSEMTYNSNTKSYMNSSTINSTRCAIGHEDLLNSPDIHAISFNSKRIINNNNNNNSSGDLDANTIEEPTLRDVNLFMSNLLSLEGNVDDTLKEKEKELKKYTKDSTQAAHIDNTVHNSESYVNTTVSYTTTETSHSSNAAPVSFASSEEYVSCSSYLTRSVTRNAHSNNSVFTSVEEKTQSRITSDTSNDITIPFTPSTHDKAVSNNVDNNDNKKEGNEQSEEEENGNTQTVSLVAAIGNNVNREESNNSIDLKKENNDVVMEEEERELLKHSLTTCHESAAATQKAMPSMSERENQHNVDVNVKIDENKYIVTKHTHCISGTQWSLLLEGELLNLLTETFCNDIVDLFNYCGNNISKMQFQMSDVRDVHFSIAGNYLYVLFALYHDVRLSETEINLRVSLCSFPALMALHNNTAVENEMGSANNERAASLTSNASELVNKRNSDIFMKKDEQRVAILNYDKDKSKRLQINANNNTNPNPKNVEDVRTMKKTESRSSSVPHHHRAAVQRQHKRATPVNDLIRSICKIGTKTRSTSTPPPVMQERHTSALQISWHRSSGKKRHNDSKSGKTENCNVDGIVKESKKSKGVIRERRNNSSNNNNNDTNNNTELKDKSPEMPSPICNIPQPISFSSNTSVLPSKQINNDDKRIIRTRGGNKTMNTPCKSSTSSIEASHNMSTSETKHFRHYHDKDSNAVPINYTVYKESASKVKAQHGVSESNAAHEENINDTNSTSASTLRSTDQPRRWCPVPQPHILNKSQLEEEQTSKQYRHLLQRSLERRHEQQKEQNKKKNRSSELENTKETNTVNETITTVNEEVTITQESKTEKNERSEANIASVESESTKLVMTEKILKDDKHVNAKSIKSVNGVYNDDAIVCEDCTNTIPVLITSSDVESIEAVSALAVQAKNTKDFYQTSLNAHNSNKTEQQEQLEESAIIDNVHEHLLLTPKQLSSSRSSSSSSSSPSPLPSPAPSPQLPSAHSRQYVCNASTTNKENNSLLFTEAEQVMNAMERALGFMVCDNPLQITRMLTSSNDVNAKSNNNSSIILRKSRRRSISENLADSSTLSEGNASVGNINTISNKLKDISTTNTSQIVQQTNELQLRKGDILRTVDGQVILSKLFLFEYMASRAQSNIHSVFLTVSRARGLHAMCKLSLEPLFASRTLLTEWANKLHEIVQEPQQKPLIVKRKMIKSNSSDRINKITYNVDVITNTNNPNDSNNTNNNSNKSSNSNNFEFPTNAKRHAVINIVNNLKNNPNANVSNTVNYCNNDDNNENNNTTTNEINAPSVRRSSISDSIHSLIHLSEMPIESNRSLPQLLFAKSEIEPVSVLSPLSLYTDLSFSTLVRNKANSNDNSSIVMAHNKKENNNVSNKRQQELNERKTKAGRKLTSAVSTLELASSSSLESADTTTTTSATSLQSNLSTKRTRLTSNPVISINQVTPFDKSTIHVPHIAPKVRAPSKHIFVQR